MFKKSVYNSIASFASILVNSIFSIVLGRLVIQHLGSDYNGVNATATQILTILTLVEGGFTTASLVSLFDPYVSKNFEKVNAILSTTSKTLKKISMRTLIIGIIIAFFYCFVIQSELSKITIFIVFLLSISSTVFNLYFVNSYKLLFQVDQSEYFLNLIITAINVITQIVSIFVITISQDIILVRLVYFISSVILGLIIIIVAKKRYAFVNMSKVADTSLIKGTRDVLISKFTSVIYSSASVMFLSIFVSTISTSIYATYNTVISIIKNCLYSIVNAPQNAIGQLWASGDKKRINEIFNEYEYLVFLVSLCLFTITFIMIIPFITIYTRNIADVNYIDHLLAIFVVLIAFLEIIHIPSGIIILMSGDFKTSRNIQLIVCICLIISNIIGALFFEIYGLLFGTLFVNILLASLEMIYARKIKLNMSLSRFVKVYFPLFFISLFLCYVGSYYIWNMSMNFLIFIFAGIIVTVIVGIILFTFSMIINKTDTLKLCNRVLNKVKRY